MVVGFASTSTSGPAANAPVDVLDVADAATVTMRRARAAQLDRVHDVVVSGRWYVHGFRSPQAWLASSTGEAPGACSSTLEQMLVGWALNLTHRDFKMVLATWRLHADPDGSVKSAQERFESRKLHLSELLDGMGRLDGLLDPLGPGQGGSLGRFGAGCLGRQAVEVGCVVVSDQPDGLQSASRKGEAPGSRLGCWGHRDRRRRRRSDLDCPPARRSRNRLPRLKERDRPS